MAAARARGRGHVGLGIAIVMALGIGASVAALSVMQNIFIGSQPYTDVDELVVLRNQGAYRLGLLDAEAPELSWPDFLDIEAQQHVFLAVGAISSPEPTIWDTGERSSSSRRAFVTPRLLQILGVRPRRGRIFTATDFEPGAPAVALITESLWRTQLRADPTALERAIRIDGSVFTLVGVIADDAIAFLRERKEFFDEPDENACIVVPLIPGGGGRIERLLALRRENRSRPMLTVVGRLRPDFTLDGARSDLGVISQRLAEEHPDTNRGRTFHPIGLTDARTRRVGHLRPMLWAVAVLALLVAFASAVALAVADAVRRQPEMAIRHALGASRGSLIRLRLRRALSWTIPGCLAGLAFAWGALRWLDVSDATGSPMLHLSIGPGVLAAAAALTVISALALGGVGAWVLRQQGLTLALKEAGQSISFGGRRRQVLAVVVTVQVIAATSLGFVSVLLLRSMANIFAVDLGFDARESFIVRVVLPEEHYTNRLDRSTFFDRALARVRALPGVASAAISDAPPFSRVVVTFGGGMALEIPGRAPEALPPLVAQEVSSDYFESLGMTLVRGRGFTEEDDRADTPAIIVDQAFCRARLGTVDPLQAGIRMGASLAPIVGVVSDVRYDGPTRATRATMYVHRRRGRSTAPSGYLVVRPSNAAGDVMAQVVGELARTDRRVIVDEPHTLGSLLARTIAARRRMLRLLTLAAGIVLALSVFSVSASLMEFVENKLREIALRRALGATWSDTAYFVCSYVAGPCLGGLVGGCLAGWALARTLSGELFGLGAADPTTIVITVTAQLSLGLMAVAAPLKRAIGVDVARALRSL